ncbi:MAG TPA: double zinc ribbon domain-containing protein [Gaiellaceae bacterium]
MSLLDLLLPLRCAACGEPGSELCERCRERLPRLCGPICERCGAPTAWPVARCLECAGRRISFASARSALLYAGAVPRVVGAWKERGLRRLAVVLAELVAEAVPPPQVQALTCVPAQHERALSRGFHPARSLALELALIWELPFVSLLDRVGSPRRQRGLALSERSRNVAAAFAPRRGASPPPSVCLIDDVYTSGATTSVCAGALRRAGCRRVEVIALARAVRES